MALGTVTIVNREAIESRFRVIAKVAVSAGANYTTGGEVVTPASLGLNSLSFIELIGPSTVMTKHVSVDNTDPSAPKLKVGVEDGASGIEDEAASNSDQSAVVVLIAAYQRGS